MTLNVYEITVDGYGTILRNAKSPASAKYDAFLSDAFSHMTFKNFLKIANARKAKGEVSGGYEQLRRDYPSSVIPEPGTRITAEGLTGTVLPALGPTNYVVFQPDGQDREARVHPMSVALASLTEGQTNEDQ